jgi:hypothetical protein
LDHPAVDASALAVLAALATYADPAGLCWPHPKTIAAKLKKSRPWVLNVLNRLIAAGLVEKHPRKRNARSGAWEFILVNFGSPHPPAPSGVACQPADSFCQPTDSFCQPADSEQRKSTTAYSLNAMGGSFLQPDRQEQSEVADSNWVPTTEDMAFAASERPDLGSSDIAFMTKKMLTQHCGQPLNNISKIWRRWLLNERTTNAHQNPETRHPPIKRRGTSTDFCFGSNDRASRNDATARTALARLVARQTFNVP